MEPPPRPPLSVLFAANAVQIGGGNRSLLGLSLELVRRGHRVTVASPGLGPLTEECARVGLPAYAVDYLDPAWQHPLRVAAGYRAWSEVIREARPTVIHANGLESARPLALAARTRGLPIVCHVRFDVDEATAAWTFRRLPKPDAFVFNSAALRDAAWPAIHRACPRARSYVVHNALDLEEFKPAPALDRAPGRARVGIIANLLPVKGHLDFIDMARLLTERAVDAEYWLAGEDIHQTGYRGQLERRITELGLNDRIRLLGHCSRVADVINQLDTVVCASHEEPFGRCLIEAMACGKPVVATRVGGIPEVVVDGETGTLVPARDPEQLAAAVERLLHDPALRSTMGAAGRLRALEAFGIARHVDRIGDVYDEVLAARRAR